MNYDKEPLPDGWIRDFDVHQNHAFWVDTKASPPRSIWVHPYEDEQFLREHPDVRNRISKSKYESPPNAPPEDAPPPYSGGSAGESSHLGVRKDDEASQPATPIDGPPQPQRGFFGKLKDKAIGTKQERDERDAQREARRQEEKRRHDAHMQQLAEQRRLRQQAWASRPGHGGAGFGGPSGFGQPYNQPYGPPYGQPYGQPMYAQPAGGRFGRPGGFGGGGFGGGGFGGVGMPLLAGAAGGLLLGSMLDGPDWGHDGGYNDGGGYDGGGFDGGGFDGGGGGDF